MDSLGHPTPHNPHWPGLAQFFFYGTSLFVSGAALPLPFPGLGILSFFNSPSRSFFGSPLRRASPSSACDGRPLTPFTGHPFPRTALSPRSALLCACVPPFTGPHFPGSGRSALRWAIPLSSLPFPGMGLSFLWSTVFPLPDCLFSGRPFPWCPLRWDTPSAGNTSPGAQSRLS